MIRSEVWRICWFSERHATCSFRVDMVLWNCKYRKCKQKSYFHKRVEYKPKSLPISMQQWSNIIEWRMLYGKQFKPFLINWSMWTKRKLHFRYIRGTTKQSKLKTRKSRDEFKFTFPEQLIGKWPLRFLRVKLKQGCLGRWVCSIAPACMKLVDIMKLVHSMKMASPVEIVSLVDNIQWI